MALATTVNTPLPCFELKGGMFTLTAMRLLDTNLSNLGKQLAEKIQQAPNFFHYAPIVIDVSFLNKKSHLDFTALCTCLREHKLIPIGVQGAEGGIQTAAITAGLALLPESRVQGRSDIQKLTHAKSLIKDKDKDRDKEKERETAESNTNKITEVIPHTLLVTTSTKVITQPVRSGQQFYAPGGDLLVLSSVSPGAEVLADGHIHIYGPLRGRALAGVTGNDKAYIFCQSLEAELASIAGRYRISEDLKDDPYWKQAARLHLHNSRLHITKL